MASQTALPRHIAREHLAIALDRDDLVSAQRLATTIEPWFGVAKVGLELFTSVGPEAVSSFVEQGFRVFLDLKLHDIPTTVERAARSAGLLGVSYLTAHAAGGSAMLAAAVRGLADGAAERAAAAAGDDLVQTPLDPRVLAVTVLTSDSLAAASVFDARVAAAIESGCGGIVCSAHEVRAAKRRAPLLTAVVPGIRLDGGAGHDQMRVATPEFAINEGADVLVIGRPVSQSPDIAGTARAIADDVAVALAAASAAGGAT
jgi:orotidine-5'-phosphate decarboxylase